MSIPLIDQCTSPNSQLKPEESGPEILNMDEAVNRAVKKIFKPLWSPAKIYNQKSSECEPIRSGCNTKHLDPFPLPSKNHPGFYNSRAYLPWIREEPL